MTWLGRTERRVAFAIVLTAVIPLIVSIYFASSLVNQALGQAFNPELSHQLDRSLDVYQELVKTIKEDMRHEADAIAAQEPLRAAAILRHEPSIRQELEAVFPRFDHLVSLGVATPDGQILGEKTRGSPVDGATERKLEVRRPLSEGDDAPLLVAVFATPRARFDELEKSSELVRTYHEVERQEVKRKDLYTFAAILLITIVVAVVAGTWLARGVTRRIGTLAAATQSVAAGDLTIRVEERGDDEVTDLARAFNRMLGEVEGSRARIEFLQRMGAWQEMARRLAHEIKNPLTPILLAVEECHRKYKGDDPAFRKLLDTTLEIVEEEVGTLRRLVGEFSSFARLPRAELEEADLGEFVREQEPRVQRFGDEGDDGHKADDLAALAAAVAVTFHVPDEPMPAALDRQMLHRVLVNVVRNAAQAIRDARGKGEIEVSVVPERDGYTLQIDDDGPGVPDELRASIFDPYVTTKRDGTGLGLAIVKKVVVEHGGTIDVGRSPLGGARFRIRIPRLGTAASVAAREAKLRSESPPSSDRTGLRAAS